MVEIVEGSYQSAHLHSLEMVFTISIAASTLHRRLCDVVKTACVRWVVTVNEFFIFRCLARQGSK